ncbi:TlyA family RNA methyltransferase [Candidatus Manganitrophus noduliformans]|uniref:TlyA family RNA methyltransferase n=1 Tax=Candidatus Manganitrophus noduliformans TaxID=2606439 RepID=A0A7X6DQI3_9BACT|nr:TlyA family RNA methyltransferase [Candidatus Manganitrophus noduliformans]
MSARSAKPKERLDLLLQSRGLAESRERARSLILSGSVLVDGKKIEKAGAQVKEDAEIVLLGPVSPYVSRGGIKLEGALNAFHLDPSGKVVIDVGASTGGFTDCLLQRGAARVYAVDVGYGQLAWRLRQDPRVIVLERRNIRTLPPESVPEPVDLATIDVSFISLEKVIPAVIPFLKTRGEIVALVKPQFEVGKGEVGRGGIVRSSEKHRSVLDRIYSQAAGWGLQVGGSIPSPILGQKGNAEFLVYFRRTEAGEQTREEFGARNGE